MPKVATASNRVIQYLPESREDSERPPRRHTNLLVRDLTRSLAEPRECDRPYWSGIPTDWQHESIRRKQSINGASPYFGDSSVSFRKPHPGLVLFAEKTAARRPSHRAYATPNALIENAIVEEPSPTG